MLFHDPVRTAAAAHPARIAIVDRDRDQSHTYHELDRVVDRVATGLAAFDLSPGGRVGIAIGSGLPFAICFHAVRRLGSVAAPFDPALPDDRLEAIVGTLDPAVVVVGDRSDVEIGDAVTYDRFLDAAPHGRVTTETPRSPDATACLVNTSGTTGDPRLVALSWRNLVSSAIASALRLGIEPVDRWLSPLAPHHMGGLAPIVRSAVYGTTYVTQSFEPRAIAATIADAGVTGISVVPIMLQRLVEADAPLADLRFVLVGGARTPERLVRECLSQDIPIHVTYGMTETASQVATATPTELHADPTTVGQPLRWVDVTIDPEEGVGEIVVAGPIVASGYWNEPDVTTRRFTSAGFRTGDIGRRTEDGRLFVHGRLDDRIVSGGVTVDPTRVRRVLEAQPGVRGAAVVGIPDDEWGERVCALLAGDPPLVDELDREAVRGQLTDAEYPRQISITDRLPRTVSGTIDRKAVRAEFADTSPTREV